MRGAESDRELWEELEVYLNGVYREGACWFLQGGLREGGVRVPSQADVWEGEGRLE